MTSRVTRLTVPSSASWCERLDSLHLVRVLSTNRRTDGRTNDTVSRRGETKKLRGRERTAPGRRDATGRDAGPMSLRSLR
ncbi:hypothetical protein Q5P01_005292 [Channa striata]|uniref:Uncharacterized protein n=1 Tax=Channa striata TaxID=64152 RepID=A0AA88T767_CHASR|nr:hypothetical protein Q5P01_005292 [Channa striata]